MDIGMCLFKLFPGVQIKFLLRGVRSMAEFLLTKDCLFLPKKGPFKPSHGLQSDPASGGELKLIEAGKIKA